MISIKLPTYFFSLVLALVLLVTIAVAQESAAPDSNFRLGSGDVLEITVWGEEALSRQVMVRPDGKISFPLLGDILAKGRSVEELRIEIDTRIREFVPESPVSIILLQLLSPKVYIVGKVNNPGLFLMNDKMYFVQALALAGGLNPFANTRGIHVIRVNPDGQTSIPIDYNAITAGRDLSQNILLRPNDTIVVP